MNRKNFDVIAAAKKVSTFTVGVHDYQMMTPTLARVIITVSGTNPGGKETLRSEIAQLFEGQVSVVDDSFRSVDRRGSLQSYVGFVKANAEVRPYDAKNPPKGFVEKASNLLMDKADEALWEIRSGTGGQYLVKQGNEDLSELVHLAYAHKTGLPSVGELSVASVLTKEFAAFVNPESEEMDYGYVITASEDGDDEDKEEKEDEAEDSEEASDAENEEGENADEDDGGEEIAASVVVMPFGGDKPVKVEAKYLITVVNLDGEDVKAMGVEMAAGGMDKSAMVEYYKKAYFYAPDYVQSIIKDIDDMSFA